MEYHSTLRLFPLLLLSLHTMIKDLAVFCRKIWKERVLTEQIATHESLGTGNRPVLTLRRVLYSLVSAVS